MTDVEAPPIRPDVGDRGGLLKPVAETTLVERIMALIAGAALATSIAAIIVEQTAVVVLAGLFSIAMGFLAYDQQTRLTDIRTLKETHEALEAEVLKLNGSISSLTSRISELGVTVDHLEDVETALEVISKQQGKSVSSFAQQVERSRSILKEMQGNVKTTVIQNLLSVVNASDADKDSIVDEAELGQLITRLQQIGGIKVNDDRFRKVFAGGSFTSLMNVVATLSRDDIPESERIFEFDSVSGA